jgi:(p)ppGpp synthase/HD superfamily hydrolase
VLTERFHKALVFAAELHADQRRKGDGRTPYVAHLLSVCAIVLESGGDEDEAIAALLHDAVEDQGGSPTRELIHSTFGERVAAIVDACSDTDQTPKPPWRQRKEAYLAHLPTATPSARLVSAADKLHNARSILHDYRAVGEAIWDRFRGGKEGSLWYYRSIVTIYSQVGPSGLAGQLERVVTKIEALAE